MPGKPRLERAGLSGQPPVAVLDTGHRQRRAAGHADPGYDAVDRDRDPAPGRDPGGSGRRETSRHRAGGRRRGDGGARAADPDRVAARRRRHGRGVDDHRPAARRARARRRPQRRRRHLRPRPGRARRRQRALRRVLATRPRRRRSRAPRGSARSSSRPPATRAPPRPGSGTIGSPASARDALAVGALSGAEPSPRVALEGHRRTVAGRWPATRRRAARRPGPVQDTDPAVLGKRPDPDPRQGRDRAGRRQPGRAGRRRRGGGRERRAARRPARAAAARRCPPAARRRR